MLLPESTKTWLCFSCACKPLYVVLRYARLGWDEVCLLS